MATPETKVKRAFQRRVKKLQKEGVPIKIQAYTPVYGGSGTGDYILCAGGAYVEVEVKSDKGRLTPLQKLNGEEVVNAHGIYLVLKGMDQIDEVVRELKNLALLKPNMR